MICSCPKCLAQIEVDLSRVTESGNFTNCPECKVRFWISKETYARMALKKEGNVYCDKCGNLLDHSIVCASCGVMYPDYYLVQSAKPPRRQVEKPDYFSLSFSLRSQPKQNYAYTGYSTARTSTSTPGSFPIKTSLAAIVVLMLAIGGGYFYHIKKAEQIYAKNYMRALYIIKSGTDLTLNTCSQISSDWQTRVNSGQNSPPHTSADAETHLTSVKETTDRLMQLLNKPPKKFINSGEKLAKLYGVYQTTHNLAISPSGSIINYNNLTAKSQSDFNTALRDLKGSLTPELSAELQIAKAKYKGLKDI